MISKTRKTHNNTQSIPKEEYYPDEYVTIGDRNITSEMNMSNRGSGSKPTEGKETKPGQMNDTIYDQGKK